VTGLDLANRRVQLGQSVEQLAELIDHHPDEVRRWETIPGELPGSLTRELEWVLATLGRRQAMERAGIPACEWLDARFREVDSKNANALQHLVDEIREHEKTCAICQQRSAFERTLPPLPPMPMGTTARTVVAVSEAIGRLPAWLRPAATGAVLLGALTILRALFILPFRHGTQLGQTLLVVLGAVGLGAYGGAVGGVTYSLVRKPAERLGAARPYAIGLACMWAYLLAFGIPLKLFGGEDMLQTTSDWVVLAIVATLFGLLIGHVWFRKTA
jgi:hypothetical protein